MVDRWEAGMQPWGSGSTLSEWWKLGLRTVCKLYEHSNKPFYKRVATMLTGPWTDHEQFHINHVPAHCHHTAFLPCYPAVPTFVPTRTNVLGKLKTFETVHRVPTSHYRVHCVPMCPKRSSTCIRHVPPLAQMYKSKCIFWFKIYLKYVIYIK